MSKTLKTKQKFAFIAYSNLKRVPPKEVPSIDEMDALMESILPTLAEHVGEHAKFQSRVDEITGEKIEEKIDEKEERRRLEELNKEYVKYDRQNRDVAVEVEFENEPFNKFFQMFERWGKTWYSTVEEFLEARKDMNKANSQPSENK